VEFWSRVSVSFWKSRIIKGVTIHRLEHGTIKDLNIAFPGNARLRVTQDALHDFVLGSQCIQVRGEPSPERAPPVPRQVRAHKSWPNHSPPTLSTLIGRLLPE
jgi:hypothetical protein